MTPSRLLLPLAAVVLAACGAAPEAPPAPAPSTRTSSLEAAFERAAYEYQVPVGILKSVAYVETRLAPDAAQSLSGGFGMMQLVKREDWNSLERAAQLTGVDEGRLKLDAEANIRGAAAVLRELADKSFASYADLNPSEPGDFWHAVSLYAGLSSPRLGEQYAREVFTTMETGFNVDRPEGVVTLAPTLSSWRRHLPKFESRADGLKEYPGAFQWLASPNFSAGRSSYSNIIIHTTQGSYGGTLSWFQNTASSASSHYVVRSSDGQVTQMVEHKNTAWHAQCYNGRAIGIEHEGFIADPGRWYTEALYNGSAKLTRWIADRHGIPLNRTAIIGHMNVPRNCNTNGHSDPGTGWNWTKYMALVGGTAPTETTGVFTGAIYQNASTTNRVAGAVVTVNGKSVTTGADGQYEFTLPPGSYTATVTKAGYSSNSVTRTVTAGATIWGSMEINTSNATGTLRGNVFVYNPANPADMANRVAGATVTVGSNTVTTDATGGYTFTLAPGIYTVNVSKAGMANNSVTRQVTSGGVIWGSVGLSPAGTADIQAPALNISFPADKSATDVAMVTLTGTASDNMGAVGTVMLKINNGTAQAVPVSGGQFSHQIKLGPGTNVLEITATDGMGNTGKDTATVTFNAGVSGYVHSADNMDSRIKDATVELLDPKGGTKIATTTTGADGSFRLNSPTVGVEYILVARASGYMRSSETVTIPDDARLDMKLPLTPGEDMGPDSVGITFMDPKDGTVTSAASITVYGTVAGFDLASVTVNGVAGEQIGAGGFSATIALVEGPNVVEAIAKGTNGESVSGKITITRDSTGKGVNGPGGANQQGASGGCAAVPTFELLALGALLPLLRRRMRR